MVLDGELNGPRSFLSLRPSGSFWTLLSGGEQFLPPALATLASLSFRSGVARTGFLGVAAPLGVFMGDKAYFLSIVLLKMLTQALKPAASAFSGTSPSPWPLQPILEVGLVVEVCPGEGGGLGSVLRKLLSQSQGQGRLSIYLVFPLQDLQSLTPTERRRRENTSLWVWDRFSIIKTAGWVWKPVSSCYCSCNTIMGLSLWLSSGL